MKRLFRKYKDIILYVFFGGCTTIVNVIIYYFGSRVLELGTVASTMLAWWVAVLFAYLTNRVMVFHSSNKEIRAILLEFTFFVACRLLTGILDIMIMFIFVERLGWNDLILKFVSNLLVILANYVASRMLIFKKHTHRRKVNP